MGFPMLRRPSETVPARRETKCRTVQLRVLRPSDADESAEARRVQGKASPAATDLAATRRVPATGTTPAEASPPIRGEVDREAQLMKSRAKLELVRKGKTSSSG